MPVDSNAALKTIELLEHYREKLSLSSADPNLIDAIDRVIDIFNSQFFIALLEIQQFYNDILLNESITVSDKTQRTLKFIQSISGSNAHLHNMQPITASTINTNRHHHSRNHTRQHRHHNTNNNISSSSASVGKRLANDMTDLPNINNNNNNINNDSSSGVSARTLSLSKHNSINNNFSEPSSVNLEEEPSISNEEEDDDDEEDEQLRICEEEDDDDDGHIMNSYDDDDDNKVRITNDSSNNPSSPLIKRPIIMEAVLVKAEDKGYGFSVAGGIDNPYFHPNDPGIYITRMSHGGIADSSGSLLIHDQILSVNGINMTYLTHEAAVMSLKEAGNKLNLVIQRDPSKRKPRVYGVDWKKKSTSESSKKQQIDIYSPSKLDDEISTEPIVEMEASKLRSDPTNRLSTMLGIHNNSNINNPRSYSSSIRSNTSYNSGSVNRLKSQSQNNKVIYVTLLKNNRGLGFSIGGGRGNEHYPGDPGIYITKVSENGVANQSGMIHEGDRLIQVNEYVLTDVSHEEAVNILCGVGSRVDLRLIKGPYRSSYCSNNSARGGCGVGTGPTTISNTTLATSQSEHSRCSSSKDIIMSDEDGDQDEFLLSRESELSPENIFEEDHFSKRSARVVILERNNEMESLGFNIVGGEDEDGIFVSYITPDGIAQQSENVAVGDRIWQVNGEDISTATHDEAAALLKNAGRVVELLLTTDIDEYMVFESKFSNWSAFDDPHGDNRYHHQQQLPQPTNKWLSSKSTPNLVDETIVNGNTHTGISRGQSPLPLANSGIGLLTNYNRSEETHRSVGEYLDAPDLGRSSSKTQKQNISNPKTNTGENISNSDKYKSCRSINVFTENRINTSIKNSATKEPKSPSKKNHSSKNKESTAIMNQNEKENQNFMSSSPNKIKNNTTTNNMNVKSTEENDLLYQYQSSVTPVNNEPTIHEPVKAVVTNQIEKAGGGIVKKTGFYVRALFDFDPDTEKNVPSRPLTFLNNDIMLIVNSADPEWWQARLIEDSNENGPLGIIPSPRRLYRKEKRQKKKVNFDNRPNSTTGTAPANLLSRASISHETTSSTNSKSNNNSSKKSTGSKISTAFMKRFSSSNSISKSAQNLSLDSKQNLEKCDSGPLLTSDDKLEENKIMQLFYEPLLKISLNYVRPIVIIGPMREKINDKLIAEFPDLFASCVPHTTRPRRPYEEHGKDYYFVENRHEMENDIKHQKFIEAGQYRGNLYGTSIEAVREISRWKHCVLDVSALAIKRLVANSLLPITVLIRPPTVAALCGLSNRITISQADQQLHKAEELQRTLSHYFTAVIWEDSFGALYSKVKSIIQANSGTDIWVPKSQNMLVL